MSEKRKSKKDSKKDVDKKSSKEKLNKEKNKGGGQDEDKDKKEEEKTDDDMSAFILKGLEQLNELAKSIEEQVGEYIKRKGPLEVADQCCMGPITNCGPSCLVTTFNPCPPPCCPPQCCKPAPRNSVGGSASQSGQAAPPRCPCCGTVCSPK